jgi:hypothetical protein
MMKKLPIFIGLLFCLALVHTTQAQILLNMPNNTKNTRFYTDINNIVRPALSIVGFDNGGDNSKGYGLKQILNRLYDQGSYNQSAIDLMVSDYDQIVGISKELLTDPFNDPKRSKITAVNRNSNILQCRAFVALARYVLYKNGRTDQVEGTTNDAKSYEDAIADLHTAFFKPKDWLLPNGNSESDQGKWTRSMDNYARALDLYLALEINI